MILLIVSKRKKVMIGILELLVQGDNLPTSTTRVTSAHCSKVRLILEKMLGAALGREGCGRCKRGVWPVSRGEVSRGMGRLKGWAALTAAWLGETLGGEVELALCLSAISATLQSCRDKGSM